MLEFLFGTKEYPVWLGLWGLINVLLLIATLFSLQDLSSQTSSLIRSAGAVSAIGYLVAYVLLRWFL